MSKFLTSFPVRVWFETEHGWASREATKEDTKRRHKFLFDAAMRQIAREDK